MLDSSTFLIFKYRKTSIPPFATTAQIFTDLSSSVLLKINTYQDSNFSLLLLLTPALLHSNSSYIQSSQPRLHPDDSNIISSASAPLSTFLLTGKVNNSLQGSTSSKAKLSFSLSFSHVQYPSPARNMTFHSSSHIRAFSSLISHQLISLGSILRILQRFLTVQRIKSRLICL